MSVMVFWTQSILKTIALPGHGIKTLFYLKWRGNVQCVENDLMLENRLEIRHNEILMSRMGVWCNELQVYGQIRWNI